MNISPNKIILGSAFCPPTIGHHAIVNALRTIENIDTIRLVPSGPRIDKVYALHNDIRRKLIEVFVSEFDDPRIIADFTFFDSSEQTTTLGMDQYYREKNGVSPIQVFGADVVKTMETWPNSPEDRRYILEQMPKIFLSRSGVELDLSWRGNYQILDADIPEASSTAVREHGRLDLLTTWVREVYERLVLGRVR